MIAFTREVSDSITRCELTHLNRSPIDLDLARKQHIAYESALVRLGCTIHSLPEAAALPDAVFVQDAALVFDEIAVITRPGAKSRRPETASLAEALFPYRQLRFIDSPGTLDGGDVVCLGRNVFVGQTARTNADGARQMAAILQPFGYTVRPITPTGCLHLQSAITPVAEGVALVNRQWVDPAVFGPVDLIDVDPDEPFAANALRVGDAIIFPDNFPKTQARLEARGLRVIRLDVTELAKAEAGVTCCCLLLPSQDDRRPR